MKKSFFTILLALVAAVSVSAKGPNKRVIFTTTPEMHCQGCEDKIQGNLRFVKGVKIIQTDRANQRVTITYDSTKCSTDVLVKEFKKIKYEVKEVDPNSIPSCCAAEPQANAKADKKSNKNKK